MDLPLYAVTDYIIHAFEQEKEQYAWELWKSMYPNMALGWQQFVKFEEFKLKLFQKNYKYTQKTNEEIAKEMMAVVTSYEKKEVLPLPKP